MAGLIILGAAFAYVVAFCVLFFRAKKWTIRACVLIAALAIPFWELPFGYWNFHIHCRSESGIHISKDYGTSRSILLENFSHKPRELMSLGYDVVEYSSRGKIVRYSKDGDGMSETVHQSPISKIGYKELGWTELPWNLGRYDRVVVRLSDGQTIARQTSFSWRGLSWEMWLRAWITPSLRCPETVATPFLSSLPRPK